MQTLRSFMQFFALLLLSVLLGGCHEYHFTMKINPNGSTDIILETAFPRQQVELQVEQIENFLEKSGRLEAMEKERRGRTSDTANPAGEEDPQDRILRDKLIAFYKEMNRGNEKEIADVRFTEDMVRIRTIQSFASLNELFSDKDFAEEFGFEGLRLTPVAENRATLTVYRDPQSPSPIAAYLKRAASKNMKLQVTFQMPGPVVASSFPRVQDNTTGIEAETDNRETVEAFFTSLENTITIKFDKGDLALEAAMDSKSMQEEKAAEQRIGSHLPLTDARQNYDAEALTLTTTENIQFEAARTFLKDARDTLFDEQNGLALHIRFYTPEGYDVVSLHKLVIVSALDDRNRSLALPDDPGQAVQVDFNPNDPARVKDQMDVTLHLPMPVQPVQTIKKLELEAELVICEKWKRYKKNMAELEPGTEYELDPLMPGVRLTAKKVAVKDPGSGELELVVHSTGNPMELTFGCELNNSPISIYTNEVQQPDMKNRTRHLVLHYTYYTTSNIKTPNLPDLVISRPDGMKRQKTHMVIRDIDIN